MFVGRSKSQTGFTLIELIVLIAILGILSAIAVPRFSGVIERAHISADQTKLRTLNSVTSIARIAMDSDDPFIDVNKSDEELISFLQERDYLDGQFKAQTEDADFVWSFDDERWYLMIDGSSLHYLLTTDDYELSEFTSTTLSSITNIKDIGKNIQIPEGIETISGGRDNKAFWQKGLESVILPNSLKEIRAHAFQGNNFKEILIPNNVEEIKGKSFYNNPITKITMTSDQVNIGERAFGSGWTEAKEKTDAFKEAYSEGGPGTYIWDGDNWSKE
nr:leucine-rich repeat protein [Halanaerobium polyolivorans]